MLGMAGSRKFPEAHGRALTRWLVGQFGAQTIISGLAHGPDTWLLEEAIGVKVVRNDDHSIWVGPDYLRNVAAPIDDEDRLPAPVWYLTTQRVRVADSTPCITHEACFYPYRRDLGQGGGFARNTTMAERYVAATWLVLWDEESKGTAQMLGELRRVRAHVEVYTPACPPGAELRAANFLEGDKLFSIVYHGPTPDVSRVVAVLGADKALHGKPYREVRRELLSAGIKADGAPYVWTRP